MSMNLRKESIFKLWKENKKMNREFEIQLLKDEINDVNNFLNNLKLQLKKLEKNVKEKGCTIIALRLFIAESGYDKLEIALSRGKREYDKREDMKKKDTQRQLDRLRKK